jgi:crotonobetainyl-CoA:carnitine CoA-transferase CaiB-like acyl-CoA transferase
MVVETEHPVAGRITNIGNPVKLSETPWQYRAPAPILGADTDAILASLGYDEATVARYREEGIV